MKRLGMRFGNWARASANDLLLYFAAVQASATATGGERQGLDLGFWWGARDSNPEPTD
jgi:hypothetical protein